MTTNLNWLAIAGTIARPAWPVATRRPDRITVIVLPCPDCAATHQVGVILRWTVLPEPDLSFTLPEHCLCGAPLDTPTHIRDVHDAARLLWWDTTRAGDRS
jgi:hypothetical protein